MGNLQSIASNWAEIQMERTKGTQNEAQNSPFHWNYSLNPFGEDINLILLSLKIIQLAPPEREKAQWSEKWAEDCRHFWLTWTPRRQRPHPFPSSAWRVLLPLTRAYRRRGFGNLGTESERSWRRRKKVGGRQRKRAQAKWRKARR